MVPNLLQSESDPDPLVDLDQRSRHLALSRNTCGDPIGGCCSAICSPRSGYAYAPAQPRKRTFEGSDGCVCHHSRENVHPGVS